MKKMIITFCLGIFFLIPLSVTHALDFGTNVLVQATDKQLLKMKLDDEALTIFLIDTSGNMQNKDKQTTIDLINRFAVESEQARIAVIAYDNDSQVLVAPTTDSTVIREKLSTLESSGESNLTAGLKTAEELIKQSQNQKANIFIIADNAPTAGDTLKKGTYTSKDSHSYKYANAADEYAKQLKKSKVSIRTLIYLARVAKSTQAQTQRFFENIQNDGFFDISQNDHLDFLFERQRTNETLLTGQFDYGVRYGHRDAQTQFHYSDDYFKASSDAYQNKALPYNPSLATMSLNLELAAWASPTQNDYLFKSDNAKKLLGKLGFNHFEANDGFKFRPTKDSIGAIAAEKKLTVDEEDYTLIALAIRGGGYEAEWASNVTLGTSGQHQGFHKASQDVLKFLDNYIKTHHIKGKIKLWLTGYSRGGATANLLAGELNSGRKLPQVELAPSDLYAFCFEPPAGTLASFDPRNKKNDNIINIVNLNDVVTKVAPDTKNFEFTRYGKDILLPTRELVGESQYSLLRDRMLRELEKIESLDDYIVDNFKWKKLSLNVNLSNKSIKFSVNDNNQNHILTEYLEKVIGTFTAEELLNRNYYVQNHQESVRGLIAAFLADSNDKAVVSVIELIKIIVDLKTTSVGELITRPLQQKLGQALGLDDITRELNSSALELFGDFILKHPNLTLTLFENLKIVGAAHQPEICLAWLRSQDKNYTDPLPILQNRSRSVVVEEKKTYYKTNVIIEGLAFGKILGGGVTQEFDKAELYAIPFENGQFDGWYKDGTLISKELECDYTVTEESTLVARFSAIEESANEK
ncbi:MAG: VWA domain-containing protein [Lactococcus chungangensis]|nr:VWA domain-containing protein [Lactococcus chungangensis]